MIGNPIDYDKKFKDNLPIFPPKFDPELRRYINLVPGKEVLDLGIGQGRNSIPLADLGFNVTGVDFSTKYLEFCKKTCDKLNLIHSDIRAFNIEKDKYNLIHSRFVLHFFHKQDSYEIIKNIKENLFWAFIYNGLGIPVAAGIFSGIGLTLSPELAGLAMAFSSISVMISSLMLNKVKIA